MVVAPRAGAWIETCPAGTIAKRSKVAPRAGAWIETFCLLNVCRRVMVAPRAGAWIETSPIQERPYAASSRPVRARGLKLTHLVHQRLGIQVAPRAGAWIETCMT